MKRFSLLALLLLAVIAGSVGCGVFGSSAPEGPLRLAPDDARELILINTSEAALSRTTLPQEFEDSIAALRDYGDINEQAWLRLPSGTAVVSAGVFDYAGIREVLTEGGHAQTTRRGFELWEAADGLTSRAMLEDDGYFISGATGAVSDVLRAVDRGQGLLWNDGKGELKRALDAMGEGLLTTASADCRLDAPGCEAAAWVFARGESRRTLEGTATLRFRDAESAATAAPAIDRAINANPAIGLVSVTPEEEVVTVQVSIGRDDFGGLEFPLAIRE